MRPVPPHMGEPRARDLILGPRSVLVYKIVSFFSRGPQWIRLRAQGPWLCQYLGPCPAEIFMYTMSEALFFFKSLFFIWFLDHGQSSGTLCENVVSVKMVI